MKRRIDELTTLILSELRLYGYKQDERIPSTRDFSWQYAVKPSAVVRVFERLTAQGLLYKKNRSGYFIAKIDTADMNKVDKACEPGRINIILDSDSSCPTPLQAAAIRHLHRSAAQKQIPLCLLYTRGCAVIERKIMRQLLAETASPALFMHTACPDNYDLVVDALEHNTQRWLFMTQAPLPGLHVNYIGIDPCRTGVPAAPKPRLRDTLYPLLDRWLFAAVDNSYQNLVFLAPEILPEGESTGER